MAVADLGAWTPPAALPSPGAGRELLVEGPGFVFERLRLDRPGMVVPAPGRPVWLAMIGGTAQLGGAAVAAGEVWYADTPCALAGDGEVLLAYPGTAAVQNLWRPA
jgi:hypothetical protein